MHRHSKETTLQHPSAVVIGGGPAGLVAALALVDNGVPTALVARRTATDNRTSALVGSSVAALDALGVWARCRARAAPLRVLRIADDTGRLWRSPETRFAAAEIGHHAFGWNIENTHLLAALWERVAATPLLAHVDGQAQAIMAGADRATVTLDDGAALHCPLIVGADGRNSLCRAAAGIAVTTRRYPQTALTYILHHARPHDDTSTEFHTVEGPFTLVPLPGRRSSVVCVAGNIAAERLAGLSGAALDIEIERRSHSILGKLRVDPVHGIFPLATATPARMAANRIALVGEAGHLLPPIGAQGLNLGLRDAASVAEVAGEIYRSGGDIGGTAATDEYHRRRHADVTNRTVSVDLLNRSLLADVVALQGLRGFGLYALTRLAPLRRAVMREGVAPATALPGLMRMPWPDETPSG